MYYAQVAPIPVSIIAAVIGEAEKQGYFFVTHVSIGVVEVKSLQIAKRQEIALSVVFRSENEKPLDMQKLGFQISTVK